jgi:hypothetical protein
MTTRQYSILRSAPLSRVDAHLAMQRRGCAEVGLRYIERQTAVPRRTLKNRVDEFHGEARPTTRTSSWVLLVQERNGAAGYRAFWAFNIEQTSMITFRSFYGRGLCKKKPNAGSCCVSKPQSSKTLAAYWNSRERLTICFWASSAGWNGPTKSLTSSPKRSRKVCIAFNVLCF